jgi:hypothetical protein
MGLSYLAKAAGSATTLKGVRGEAGQMVEAIRRLAP